MRDKAFDALVRLGVKHSSIQYCIEKGWLNSGDYSSYKNLFINIHQGSGLSSEGWNFDFYAAHGSKVGCPTSNKCITVWRTRYVNNEKEVIMVEKFSWNELIAVIWNPEYKIPIRMKSFEQLALF